MTRLLRALPASPDEPTRADARRLFAAAAAVLTVMRLAALALSDIDLGPDETQYWFWAQTPDFGYFSKPPFIAWAVAASTALLGDGPFAVRLLAPLAQLGAAVALYALAERTYSPRAGLYAGLVWLLTPGVILSSTLISVDAFLLFFWSVALLAFFRLADPGRRADPARGDPQADGSLRLGWAGLLGAATGLGLMAKYAMIYFPIGAAAALFLTRARIRIPEAILAGAVAAAIFAPNIWWNAEHDFQTVAHTAANANWGERLGRPGALLEFLAAQFGVFGPIALALLIGGVFAFRKRAREAGAKAYADIGLLCFTAPPLLIVSLQAFLSRAHANWAAAAYPSAAILIAAWAARGARAPWFRASLVLHLTLGALFAYAVTDLENIDRAGFGDAIKRVRGWEAQGAAIAEAAAGYDAILADDREIIGGLVYYARKAGKPVVALNSNHRIDHHYEAFHGLATTRSRRLLFVTDDKDARALIARFERTRPLGPSAASPDETAGRFSASGRTLYLFEVEGPIPPAY